MSNLLAGLQERFYQYRNDEALLDDILRQGAEKARAIAKENPCQSVRSRSALSLQNNFKLNKPCYITAF